MDPVKVEAGRKGGLSGARKRLVHLSDVEFDVLRELERQVYAYRRNTAGAPSAVAAWLRIVADYLETGNWQPPDDEAV